CDTSALVCANDDLPCAMDEPVCSHPSYCASLETVRDAHVRIRDHIHRTPVFTSSQLDRLTGCQLFFKCENLQKTGAFKYRGACNAVMQLTADEAAHGVVTHSSGNHAAALALAAKVRGVPAFIVLPRDTPAVKVEAIQGYGGRITLCDPGMDNREAACAQLQAQTGAVFIPPYNHPGIISGQGTLALELLEQVPDLDAVVVPVSGGGMISGGSGGGAGAAAAHEVQGTAADVVQCKAAGRLVPCEMPHTIADGLRGRLGDLTWPIVRDFVDVCVPVSESDIVTAMRLVFERLKLVVEPSGAAGLAAVLRWTQAARDSPSGSGKRFYELLQHADDLIRHLPATVRGAAAVALLFRLVRAGKLQARGHHLVWWQRGPGGKGAVGAVGRVITWPRAATRRGSAQAQQQAWVLEAGVCTCLQHADIKVSPLQTAGGPGCPLCVLCEAYASWQHWLGGDSCEEGGCQLKGPLRRAKSFACLADCRSPWVPAARARRRKRDAKIRPPATSHMIAWQHIAMS
ncbi:hypothetical protein QJQ45_016635, partial [Haematococcus lacustris]